MNFCLPPDITKKFLRGLKDGEINPGKMAGMSSEARRTYLAKFVGEKNAKPVNALFESKLLLKNQQQGMINWAKTVGGLKEVAKRDIISKVNKLDKVLSEKDQQAFLEDLAEQRLGVNLTLDEANTIAKMAKEVQEKKVAVEAGNEKSRIEYGRAKVEFSNYIKNLKEITNKKTIKEKIKNPVGAVSELAGTAKSLKASMDNSAIFRQGWKTLWTHNKIWRKNAIQSFRNIFKTYGGKEVIDELNADIVSRPNYDLMQKAKLAVGSIEEAYPSLLPEKVFGKVGEKIEKTGVPFVSKGVGRAIGKTYKASQDAFTAFVHKTRADVFDRYIEVAKRNGIDLTDKSQLESIGKLVNSLTGRGNLGALEPAANVVNNVFFSPRNLKSHVDTLLLHATDKNFSKFARKQAAINLVKIIAGTAGVLATASILKPDSVEWDPRSADFGKIKIGNTRFDVSGGMSSIVTLASRLIKMSTKSSTTGKVSPLNARDKSGKAKFGAQTGGDVVYNFFENKLSPLSAVVKDIIKGEDFEGKKPTVLGEAKNLLVPIPITNFQELKNDPKSANILISLIVDSLGIGTNTYGPKK